MHFRASLYDAKIKDDELLGKKVYYVQNNLITTGIVNRIFDNGKVILNSEYKIQPGVHFFFTKKELLEYLSHNVVEIEGVFYFKQ